MPRSGVEKKQQLWKGGRRKFNENGSDEVFIYWIADMGG
jgi:hypothetical protein